jgi:hypothetical protein
MNTIVILKSIVKQVMVRMDKLNFLRQLPKENNFFFLKTRKRFGINTQKIPMV